MDWSFAVLIIFARFILSHVSLIFERTVSLMVLPLLSEQNHHVFSFFIPSYLCEQLRITTLICRPRFFLTANVWVVVLKSCFQRQEFDNV